MMTKERIYYWRGLDQFEHIQQSEIVATSLLEVKRQLLQNQIAPLTIKKGPPLKYSCFKKYDLLLITRQLTTMLESGLTLIAVLTIMIDEQTNLFWRALLKQVRSEIDNGHSLADALHQFPMTFSKIYRQTLSAGEKTGQLLYCLKLIVKDLEKTSNLNNKIKRSLRYPMLLAIITIVSACIMLFFLLPQFKQIYSTFKADLPWFSNTMLCFGNHLRRHFLSTLLLSIPSFIFLYYFIKYKYSGQLQQWVLSVPGIGKMVKSRHLYFLFQHLSLTHKAAIPLVEGLELVINHISSTPYIQVLTVISTKVKLGHSLSSTLEENSLFPAICRQCIRAGEESGTLGQMLEQLAKYYQQQTDESIDKLVTNIEPILLLIFCLVIGSFALTLYLPILHLGEVML